MRPPRHVMKRGNRDEADEVQSDGVADGRFMGLVGDAVIPLDGFQRLVESSFGRAPKILG
jgi:hypothetical protein